MTIELIVTILKYSVIVFTAGYGVYATVTDFKEEKLGTTNKELTKGGRIGIGLLLVGALFSLFLEVFKDTKEKTDATQKATQEAEKRREDLERVERILAGLGNVRDSLGDQANKMDVTQKALDENYRLTNVISGDLNETARSLLKTANKADSILQETTENITHMDIRIRFAIKPAALFSTIKNEKGENIVDSDLLKAIEGLRPGITPPGDLSHDMKVVFWTNYSLFRNIVLRSFFLSFSFEKRTHLSIGSSSLRGLQADMFLPTDSRVLMFFINFIDEVKSNDGSFRGYACDVIYRVPPNRFAGFRKNRDMNGVVWKVDIFNDRYLLEPCLVALDIGQTDPDRLDYSIMLKDEDCDQSFGQHSVIGSLQKSFLGWEGELKIPANFFK